MKFLIVLLAAVSVSLAMPGYELGGYGYGHLPQPVQDTHEVAAAKAAHFAAHAKARAANAYGNSIGHGDHGLGHGHSSGHAYSTASVHSGHGAYGGNVAYAGYGLGNQGYHAAPAAYGLGSHGYHAAPVVLTAHGVPVDTPEVQAAKAANAAAHAAAKHQHLHG